jgi:hypothetical protein
VNASRPHTDGEHHAGDTTRIVRIYTPESGDAPAYEGPADVTPSDALTHTDLAAGIYLIQNQDRPDEEWDPLPDNITADDVVRAVVRQTKRREELRAAVDAAGTKLRTPLPKREHTPADQRIDRSEKYTGRVPFWFGVTLIIFALLGAWGLYDLMARAFEWIGGRL